MTIAVLVNGGSILVRERLIDRAKHCARAAYHQCRDGEAREYTEYYSAGSTIGPEQNKKARAGTRAGECWGVGLGEPYDSKLSCDTWLYSGFASGLKLCWSESKAFTKSA